MVLSLPLGLQKIHVTEGHGYGYGKVELTYDHAIPLLGIYPEKTLI